MNKYYDNIIEVEICTSTDSFSMSFTNDWKIVDMLSWMKDTFCIDEKDIVEHRVSYVKRFKLAKE